VTRSKFCVCLY